MIAEQVAQANADLSIADELSHVTARTAHTFAAGGPMGLSSAWTAGVVEFVAPALAQMAEWMVDAIAYASDLDASTLEAEQIGEVVDQQVALLATYGDLIESAATGVTVAEGSDPKLAVASLLDEARMATLDDRAVRHLRNQLITLVLAAAAHGGTIVAVATAASERTKMWVTMNDDRVRSAHAELEGVTVGVDEQFDCGGYLCFGPGDASLPLDLWINCRCLTVPGDTESTEDWLNVIFEIERKLAAGEMPPVARNGPNGVARKVVDAIRPTVPLPVPVVEPAVIAPYDTAPPSTVKKGRPLWPWLLPLLLAGEDEDETTVEGEFAMSTETHPVGTVHDAIRSLTAAGMTTLHGATWAPQWDAGPGIMVALRPTPEQAEALAIDGGEASTELHVTLAYLGKTDEWPDDMRDRVAEAVALVAQTGSPIEAKVAAVACFEDNEDRPLVWFIDGDGINELRAALVVLLDEVDQSLVRRDHGFLPHTTAQYDPTPEQEAQAAERVAYPLTFGAVELCWGSESTLFPFTGDDMPETEMAVTGELTTEFSTDPGTVQVEARVEVDGTGLQGTIDLVVVDGRLAGVSGDIEATADDPVFVVRVWEPNDEGVYEPTEQMLNAHAGGLTPVGEFGDPVDNPEPPPTGEIPEEDPIDGEPIDEAEMTVGIGEPVSQTWTVCPRPSGAFRPAEFLVSAYRAELEARAAAGDWDYEAVLCVENQPSGDYRMMAPGSLRWREPPLSLMVMIQNPETGGHALAYIAGSIWELERVGDDIMGRGFYSRSEWGELLRSLVDEGSLTGVSVDLQPDFTYEILVGADGEEMLVVTDAVVMGATACNFGAIAEAEIWNLGGEDVVAVDDDEAEMLVASGFAVWSLDDGCYAQAEALELAAEEPDPEVPEPELASV